MVCAAAGRVSPHRLARGAPRPALPPFEEGPLQMRRMAMLGGLAAGAASIALRDTAPGDVPLTRDAEIGLILIAAGLVLLAGGSWGRDAAPRAPATAAGGRPHHPAGLMSGLTLGLLQLDTVSGGGWWEPSSGSQGVDSGALASHLHPTTPPPPPRPL